MDEPFIFVRESHGGPNEAEREEIRADWARKQRRRRHAQERRYQRDMNAASCGLRGAPVEVWRLRKPHSLSTCSACEQLVWATPWQDGGTGLDNTNSADALRSVLRVCTIAHWHLEYPDWGTTWRRTSR
jgi:hypothetical protein